MKPLTGLKVIDISRVLAGPYCGQLLADMGAKQIAVFCGCRGEVRHGNGDVVEPADHRLESLPSIWLNTEKAALSTLVPGPKMAATPAS